MILLDLKKKVFHGLFCLFTFQINQINEKQLMGITRHCTKNEVFHYGFLQ